MRTLNLDEVRSIRGEITVAGVTYQITTPKNRDLLRVTELDEVLKTGTNVEGYKALMEQAHLLTNIPDEVILDMTGEQLRDMMTWVLVMVNEARGPIVAANQTVVPTPTSG